MSGRAIGCAHPQEKPTLGSVDTRIHRLLTYKLSQKPTRSRRAALASRGFVSRNARGHSFHGSSSEYLSGYRRRGLRSYRSVRLFLLRVGIGQIRYLRATEHQRLVLGINRILPISHDQQWQRSVYIRTGA
jgi:hypothetical protein